ncbi:Pkinase-domain-containing protein [Metschnikowia bicuspidata var. bicuspidata NRRL YB-4993]|uniref:non-specific serine/threonine protein kinase n=1 Tax=Metschnikowia bicuspidata var. bicuspidata NRRL YB-4993 TaxID=869754 RepID=A0A1A0HFU5_9ASCO|nr:Pkinase-domain-containing protein [Metschnikowia bicuspidata var. bicuspidata NRRL YB-4993]OBA22767.1 Pkinase-domain-containing protein [Metschnikowia bicuspidata var. bicuspidata NRRL YB-4993]
MTGAASPFYFADDEDSTVSPVEHQCRNIAHASVGTSSLSKVSSRTSEPPNLEEILLFPVENSHAYSYAHLSPNSLALRLNVLKRSLEILNERPDWLKTLKPTNDISNFDDEASAPPSPLILSPAHLDSLKRKLVTRPLMHRLYLRSEHEYSSNANDRFKLTSNASSAALNALFRPKLSRSESLLRTRVHSGSILLEKSDVGKPLQQDDTLDADDSEFTDDLKDIIELIEQDATLLSSKKDIAATLHDLSLSSGGEDVRKKQNALKNKLLFALATPFVETAAMAAPLWGATMPSSMSISGPGPAINSSTTALNLLAPQNGNSAAPLLAPPGNRPFHAISAGKHASPQSIITVDADFPWSFKAANDLACLMFGVLKSMIKNLTLIDLIAPQFRNFVTERMTKVMGNIDRRLKLNKTIIFAGEIIAISRYSEGDFAWTSIWAQKKDNLIICMFEQITCDAFDVLILCDVDNYKNTPYTVTSIEEIAGNLITKSDTSRVKNLQSISESLDMDLKKLTLNHEEDAQYDWEDSSRLNRYRYYTLQLAGDENIPCALTSYPLEKDDTKFELKLKIHSMPYIAGMIVVEFSDLKVLSCNKAIAKNLFGVLYDDILGHSVDTIIPEFSKILQAGLEDQDSAFQIAPGLVLPEHFFRKYSAIMKLSSTDVKSAEHAFLYSRGIEGLHRDGKSIFIDVQLRVVRPDVFVLWVTYSRHSNKSIHKHLHKLSSSSTNEAPLPLRPKGTSSRVNLPSQMKLFPENESDILELGSSSSDISRHSSTRRPKRVTTFSVPITYMSDSSSKQQLSKDLASTRSISISGSTYTASDVGKSSTRPSSIETEDQEKLEVLFYRNFSEQEILSAENKELEERKSKSRYWPSKIGEKKRTKKYTEFNILKNMGEGAYGKVVLAEHKDDPAYKIIIKCIDKQRILVDTWVRDRQLGTIPSEIQIMATLNQEPHPNIMRIIDYFEDPNYYYLETPVFGDPPAIDLFDYIEVKNNLSELNCQLIFKQVVLAIYFLHKQGIVHRDIKDENIIVNEVGVVKLIDFGSAGYVKLGPFDVFVGTVDYASPEVLRGEKYDGKPQDIWALGILLYIMLYKENPFYNVDDIMEGELRVPFVVSETLVDLIEKILVRDIKGRPTITDIAEHEWLNV